MNVATTDTVPPPSGKLAWPQRILVAEDEALLARQLTAELTHLGLEVIGPASNGVRAIELAREHNPDIALLDIRMPEMDGLEASRVLQEEFAIPAIFITAYSDREFVNTAAEHGAMAYLLKPISVESLRVTLQVAWSRHLELNDLKDQVADLNRKLEHRKIIERAKGMIMHRLGLSESDAMRRLQKQSRDSRRPMIDLARSIIDAEELLEPSS
ncbi:MAG: response regulator [Planctomycetota bacterium]